jgi:hypothetical protein
MPMAHVLTDARESGRTRAGARGLPGAIGAHKRSICVECPRQLFHDPPRATHGEDASEARHDEMRVIVGWDKAQFTTLHAQDGSVTGIVRTVPWHLAFGVLLASKTRTTSLAADCAKCVVEQGLQR